MNSKFLSYFMIFVITLTSTFAHSSQSLCDNNGYVVGFFNGVWNSKLEAGVALSVIKERTGERYNAENIDYELFYNHTGSAVGATAFQDLAEVFTQRAKEISPDFAGRFDVFWSAVSGDPIGFNEKIRNVVNGTNDLLVGLVDDLYTEITTEVAGAVSQLVSNPPTASDYARHTTRLKTLASQGSKLLLIAHSQGNLFVNNAYDSALQLGNISSENVGVVHIAPASSTTNGPHILANIDAVINGLKVFGIHSVPNITVDLPLSHLLDDASGHTLLKTYLNNDLASSVQVMAHIDSELARLVTPTAIAEAGAFTTTLTWDGEGDVDLHVYEPNDAHVYYGKKRGDVGYLDLDNIEGFGPEHYFASCDADILADGIYQIGVNSYSRAEGKVATVQVSTARIADLITTSMVMGPSIGSDGNNSPIIYILVEISRDENGVVSIKAADNNN